MFYQKIMFLIMIMMMIQLAMKQVMDIVITMDLNGFGYMLISYKLSLKLENNKKDTDLNL